MQGFLKGDGEGNDYDGDGEPDSEQAFAAVASYSADIFTVNLGYTDQEFGDESDGNVGLTGIVDLAPISLAARVQQVGDIGDTDAEKGGMLYGVLGSFDYGPGFLTAAVQQVDVDWDENGADSRTEFLFNANYAIAENLYVYGEAGLYDLENDLGNYTAVGALYSF